MDSIKAKVIRAPQRTGYKTFTYSDAPGGVAQAYSSETSANLKMVVPKGAIITAVPAIVTTAFAGPNTLVWGSGHVANSFSAAGASLASAAAALASTTATWSIMTKGVRGSGDHTAAQGPGLGVEASYQLTESGEREYAVHASVTYGNTTASNQGVLVWWVEYMFAPNIVWEQSSLA